MRPASVNVGHPRSITWRAHRYETELAAGRVAYDPEPLDRPPAGSVLPRCAGRAGDLALDA
jgi:hypothetical protein